MDELTGIKPLSDRILELVEEIESQKTLYQRRQWLTNAQALHISQVVWGMKNLAKLFKKLDEVER